MRGNMVRTQKWGARFRGLTFSPHYNLVLKDKSRRMKNMASIMEL